MTVKELSTVQALAQAIMETLNRRGIGGGRISHYQALSKKGARCYLSQLGAKLWAHPVSEARLIERIIQSPVGIIIKLISNHVEVESHTISPVATRR